MGPKGSLSQKRWGVVKLERAMHYSGEEEGGMDYRVR